MEKVVLFQEKFYNKAEQEVQGEHILKIGERNMLSKNNTDLYANKLAPKRQKFAIKNLRWESHLF